MSLGYPKQYAKIGSKTVIEHTISALLSSPYVANVIVGINKDDPYYDSLPIASNPRVIKGLGGTERCDYYSGGFGTGMYGKIVLQHGNMKDRIGLAADLQELISKRNRTDKVIIANKSTEILL